MRNKKLEELDRLKSQFFANVSHELRTPLTLILSPVEDLLRKSEALPEKVHEALLIVMQNALRLLKLINDLLDAIRLEEGALNLAMEPVNLSTYIPGIVDSMRHLGGTKRLKMQVEGGSDPLLVAGDPDRLEKVFLNLLSNAIKFTPAGGIITTRWRAEEEMAVVEVEDTGIGVSEEELPLIFDRFHQADGSSTRKYQGVGIGLALAQDLVEKHRGRLTAESKIGKGTVFRMELPVLSGNLETAPGNANGKRAPAEREPFLEAFKSADRVLVGAFPENGKNLPTVGRGNQTLLVVDDEPDMRRFLVSRLSEDYRVLQAADGESGLALARKELPDLVLLDWMLPGMDGLEVSHELRAGSETKEIKIILLTARVDEASKIRALEEGADDFLTKPFSTIEVQTRISNLLRTAALQKDLKARNVDLEKTLRKLKETESQLVQSEKMSALGSLSAGLLHEINNPLNYTLTALQIGRQFAPEGNEELKETLDDIDEGMHRISDIVSDLHTFAYPEKEGKIADFSLAGSIESALRLVAHEINGLSVIKKVDENSMITGSKTQIVHLFTNLLVNASKAVREVGEARSPEISIMEEQHNGRIEIEVRDNGTGISADVLGKIFDPFYTTRDVGEGMGLGLSICHTIVKNHGGNIRAESREGAGAAFIFDLPAAEKVAT